MKQTRISAKKYGNSLGMPHHEAENFEGLADVALDFWGEGTAVFTEKTRCTETGGAKVIIVVEDKQIIQ